MCLEVKTRSQPMKSRIEMPANTYLNLKQVLALAPCSKTRPVRADTGGSRNYMLENPFYRLQAFDQGLYD